jgi:subtilisin family serine protease
VARVLATGLPEGITIAKNDWVLWFSNVYDAWDLIPPPGGKSQGEGIVVAHPDVGYTIHPELMRGGRLLIDEGKDFIRAGQTPEDLLEGSFPFAFPSHGTKTAGMIMSAEGHPFTPPDDDFQNSYVRPFPYLEEQYVTGIAPLARVVPYKVGPSVVLGELNCAHIASAIYHAMTLQQKGLDVGVMSISMGRPPGTIESSLQQALIDARDAGIVVCAAAAQTDQLGGWAPTDLGEVAFPARDPNAIGCAACDFEHKPLRGAFYGPEVDITAPAVNVWNAKSERIDLMTSVAVKHSVNGEGTGTSYAAAMTAGACALWQAYHGRANLVRDYTAAKIFALFKTVLQRSCHKPDSWTEWDFANRGAGVLDVKALLEEPLPAASEL